MSRAHGLLGRGILLIGAALLVAAPGRAQGLLERTPNLVGPDVPAPRTASFVFAHRFELIGDGVEKVLNYPTLRLAVGLPAAFGLGVAYTSNSELGAGTPNEWELGVKRRFDLGGVAALAGTVAYNTAAESVDGEIGGRVEWGPVSVHGVVRGFSDAFGEGKGEAAVGGGGAIHLGRRLALVGDVVRLVTADDPPTAWSAGIHFAIPSTPHTLGFAVSNVGASTLQGSSVGGEDEDGDANLRYGFEFTAPLGTLEQWGRIFAGRADDRPEEETGPTVVLRDFAFDPAEIRIRAGETVHWINEDSTPHTVTADDEAFESGILETGEGYSRRFDEPGRYPYHCTPHPFMKGVVVVEPAE